MQADREDWRYGTNQCALMVTDADQKPQPNRRGSGALVVRVLYERCKGCQIWVRAYCMPPTQCSAMGVTMEAMMAEAMVISVPMVTVARVRASVV